jgi:hypothetical protein
MMADDVGAALAGPFDKYLSEWDKMRRADVDDRRNEAWPTVQFGDGRQALPHSPTAIERLEGAERAVGTGRWEMPRPGRLSMDAGWHDMHVPSKEELMQFLMTNEAAGPDPQERVPLPRNRPLRR